MNLLRVERWNAIKEAFGDDYQDMRQALAREFPDRSETAIYKKCNYCHTVWCKPKGCVFHSFCGYSGGGQDTLPFAYDYVEEAGEPEFRIRETAQRGAFEESAFSRRRQFFEFRRYLCTLLGDAAPYDARADAAYDPDVTLHERGLTSHGLVWKKIGPVKPVKGQLFPANERLLGALRDKFKNAADDQIKFEEAEWGALGIHHLRIDHYVLVDGIYYRPVSSGCGRQLNWQTMLTLTKEELVEIGVLAPERPMQQNKQEAAAPVPTAALRQKLAAICRRLGLEATGKPKPDLRQAYIALGVPQPRDGTANDKAVALEDKVDELTARLVRLGEEYGVEVDAQAGQHVILPERIQQVSLEMGMQDDVAASPDLQTKVSCLYDAEYPEGDVKLDHYLRLYQQYQIRPQLPSLQGAIREVLRGWSKAKGLPTEVVEQYGDALIQRCAVAKTPGEFIIRAWTDTGPLETGGLRIEFCSILQEVVRNEATGVHEHLKSAVVLCRGLNAYLTQRNIPRDQLVWPGGPAAPEEPLRVPGVSGEARSTEAYTTFRVAGVPLGELTEGGFYHGLSQGEAAAGSTSFRTRQFLASSFVIDVSLGFIQRVPQDREVVLFKVKIDPDSRCMHAGYLEKSSSCRGEYELLFPPFSAFTVVSLSPPARDAVARGGMPRAQQDCWTMVLHAAPDNLTMPYDFPLAHWT